MSADVLADRVFEFCMDADYYNAKDNGLTREQVKSLLVNSPETVIEMLLDYFEEV